MRGNSEGARRVSEDALKYEFAAIEELADLVEPTCSALHRSASALALGCGLHGNAEELAKAVLARNPLPRIAAQLRDLVRRSHAGENLENREINGRIACLH